MQMSENVLNRSPLFQGIAQDNIEAILSCLSAIRREFQKGESILREGDIIKNVGILLSGTAQSVKTDITGKQVIVTLIKPGNYIGVLLAASHNRTSPVMVRALDNLAVLFIPMQNILSRSDCPHHAKLLSNLLDGIAEKALVLHDRNDCLIKPTIRDKVLTFLSESAHNVGSNSFTIPMGREAMAEYLDVDRSALSRELSWMKRDGLIDYDKNWFILRV
jgi:cAMP-binding proteins - catabolite gene activator and regulatory subunit of cAMP-dependent protein kinases